MNLARFGSLLARSRSGAARRFISAGHSEDLNAPKTEFTFDYINAKFDALDRKITNQAKLDRHAIESVRREIDYLGENLSRINDKLRYHDDDLNKLPLKYAEKMRNGKNFYHVAENFYGCMTFLCLLVIQCFGIFSLLRFIFSAPAHKQEVKQASEWS